ncbi:MAG: regulatory protein RecX [Evtepia gabavorous]
MRIERLLPPAQPGRPWTVVLEGDALRVPEGTVAAFSLYDGLTLEEERLAELKSAAFVATLRERTVALLSARMLSAGQLQEKLMAKGATDRQAAEVVAWALEIGLLNEEEYAKTLARHYQARGYGMYKIKDELYRRQVPRRYWEQALAELEDPENSLTPFSPGKSRTPGTGNRSKKPQTPWCAGAFLASGV